jgi:hypothetical protein
MNLKSIILLITFFGIQFLFFTNLTSANEPKKNPWFISIDYLTGENKPHRDVIRNLTYPYQGVDIKLGWQTIGKQDWQVAYRYPSFGIGFNYSSFHTNIIGTPISTYFFTNFPQLRTNWIQIDLEVDLGLSHGINPYNSILNPSNFSTGSATNVYFGIYLEQSVSIGKHLDLFTGEGFTHYSNGALVYPNLGLNIPSLKMGLRFHPKRGIIIKKDAPIYTKDRWQLSTYIGAGTKKLFAPSPSYHQLLISPSVYYRTSFKRRIGLGLELAYNESISGLDPGKEFTKSELITFALSGSHEFIINRFTIVSLFGIYLHNQPSETFYYERIGLGYYITPSTRIVLNLKAHYFKAEYVESGVVFDLKWD